MTNRQRISHKKGLKVFLDIFYEEKKYKEIVQKYDNVHLTSTGLLA